MFCQEDLITIKSDTVENFISLSDDIIADMDSTIATLQSQLAKYHSGEQY